MQKFYGSYKRVGSEYSHVYIWQPDTSVNLDSDAQYLANLQNYPMFTAMKVGKPDAFVMTRSVA